VLEMKTLGARWSFASGVGEGSCEMDNQIQADNIVLGDYAASTGNLVARGFKPRLTNRQTPCECSRPLVPDR